jgi:hypothetical protein
LVQHMRSIPSKGLDNCDSTPQPLKV